MKMLIYHEIKGNWRTQKAIFMFKVFWPHQKKITCFYYLDIFSLLFINRFVYIYFQFNNFKGFEVIRSWYKKIMMSKGHDIKRSWYQKVMMSKGHDVKRSWCQKVMMSKVHDVKRSWCQKVMMSKGHDVKRSWCQKVMRLKGYEY